VLHGAFCDRISSIQLISARIPQSKFELCGFNASGPMSTALIILAWHLTLLVPLLLAIVKPRNPRKTRRLFVGPGRGNGVRLYQRFSLLPAEDIYQQKLNDPIAFKEACNFWPSEFDELLEECRARLEMARMVRIGVNADAIRPGKPQLCKLSAENRLLLVLLWMAHYPTYATLASQFGCSTAVVSEEIRHIVPILNEILAYELSWPSVADIPGLRQFGPEFPDVFGIVCWESYCSSDCDTDEP
jgi:hypothetical protein